MATAIVGEPRAAPSIDGDNPGCSPRTATRDAGGDTSAQVEWGVSLNAPGWSEWQPGADGPVGRWLDALAAARGPSFAKALSHLTSHGSARRSLVEAGLRATPGLVAEVEATLVDTGRGASRPLRAALRTSLPEGALEAARAIVLSEGDEPLHRLEAASRAALDGEPAVALAVWRDLAEVASGTVAGLVAARSLVAWSDDAAGVVEGLRAEAASADDPERGAGPRMLAAAAAAVGEVEGGGDDALAAAEALPSELAAMELAALFASRGEADATAAAMLLEVQGDASEGLAGRVALVRSGLRRSASEPEAAGEAVWRAWTRGRGDVGLGALVLRASAHRPDRTVEVLRARAEAAHAAGAGGVEAGVAVGLLLSEAMEEARQLPEASQALARARTLDLRDPALKMAEERLWVRAGQWAEVTERAFDRLKEAPTDEARIAAYEQLAEHDRAERGDTASAVLSYQAILEIDPSHPGALRTLERYYTEQGRSEELLGVYRRLVDFGADPDDALAYAHAGARLADATSEVEGAGVEFLRAALARGLTDRRLVTAMDAEYRRVGDLERFADVQLRAASAAGSELERATHLCRAGEAYEALGDHARARRAFEGAVSSDGASVTGLSGVARVCGVMGDPRGEAEAWEALGQKLKDAPWASTVLQRAMLLWRDIEGGAGAPPERTLATARAVLACDPRHTEAFSQALEILSERTDHAGELELIERFVATGTDDLVEEDAVALYARAASLAEALNDPARARALWQAVTTVQPTHEEALRAVSQLSFDAEDWAAAADAMVKLAKVSADPKERAELLFGLGDIFDRRLPDPKRAEAAWRRLVQAQPDDARALERLVDLYARTGERAKEVETLQLLVQRTPQGPQRVARLLRVARVAGEEGDDARARAALDVAGRELRAAVDKDPRDGVALGQFVECLSLRKRPDAARAVAAVAAALGRGELGARALAPTGVVPGAGASALSASGLDLLAPPAIPGALREVLARTSPVVDPLMPYDMAAAKAERLGARPHPLRKEIDRWAQTLDLGEVEVLIAPTVPARCLPVGRSPATVVVAAAAVDDAANRFAVARAMLLIAMGLSLPLRMSAADFSLALSAVLRQFEPMFKLDGVDGAKLDEMARSITRSFSREAQAELSPFAYEVLGRPVDAAAIHAAALECGDRVALL
ncbi:MAG: hypothetical protein R3A52_18455, partial [Polyangiales bacterium]